MAIWGTNTSTTLQTIIACTPDKINFPNLFMHQPISLSFNYMILGSLLRRRKVFPRRKTLKPKRYWLKDGEIMLHRIWTTSLADTQTTVSEMAGETRWMSNWRNKFRILIKDSERNLNIYYFARKSKRDVVNASMYSSLALIKSLIGDWPAGTDY